MMQGGDHEGEAAQSVVHSEHGQGEQAPSRLRVLLCGRAPCSSILSDECELADHNPDFQLVSEAD